jgi:hypothetical protein
MRSGGAAQPLPDRVYAVTAEKGSELTGALQSARETTPPPGSVSYNVAVPDCAGGVSVGQRSGLLRPAAAVQEEAKLNLPMEVKTSGSRSLVSANLVTRTAKAALASRLRRYPITATR